MIGDGECNEGSIWEAALSASKHKLQNLSVIIDSNQMQCNDYTKNILDMEPFIDKWKSFGFHTIETDGHDDIALKNAFKLQAKNSNKPKLILCHTVKGKGVPEMESKIEWHHKSRVSDEIINNIINKIY